MEAQRKGMQAPSLVHEQGESLRQLPKHGYRRGCSEQGETEKSRTKGFMSGNSGQQDWGRREAGNVGLSQGLKVTLKAEAGVLARLSSSSRVARGSSLCKADGVDTARVDVDVDWGGLATRGSTPEPWTLSNSHILLVSSLILGDKNIEHFGVL